MALYSFSHSRISVSEPGKTFARLAYVCRHGADVLGERHDLAEYDRASLRGFARTREAMAGKNGRVAECFILALPREGTSEDHRRIVRTFAERLTRGQAPWICALHYDKPGNPHAHLIAFDQNQAAQPGRGRPGKVMAMSRKGALEDARALWAECHNQAMAGIAPPIDHRSLAEQGKGHLLPGLHEGPALRAMKDRGSTPIPAPKPGKWVETVDWPSIDQGRDRVEVNAHIARINTLSTLYTETHNGRPDGIFAALAGANGQVPDPGATRLAYDPRIGKADPATACRIARPADRGDQAPASTSGPGTFGADDLSAGVASVLGLGRGRAVVRAGGRNRRRGVAAVGRYAIDRLRSLETAVRRLIAGAEQALSWGLGVLLGVSQGDRPLRRPSVPRFFPLPVPGRSVRQRER
ncbi:MAG: MobA/MobL family protein [Magnetospirillum gryphiswaldense]|nr:MobA/MobL family protein [Magnetospirillum gryphiswaldense]